MVQKKILIINYGMGNVSSVRNALAILGAQSTVSDSAADIVHADAYILPGVGAFGYAMENLRKLNIIDVLSEQVLVKKKPFLGICLGMQLIMLDSVEQGFHTGLGWLEGHVIALNRTNIFRLPHVGWNNIAITCKNSLFDNIDQQAHFYFDHTYHVTCLDNAVTATCFYGDLFAAAICRNNIFATQFHPEKSQRNGLKLLRNYLNIVRDY